VLPHNPPHTNPIGRSSYPIRMTHWCIYAPVPSLLENLLGDVFPFFLGRYSVSLSEDILVPLISGRPCASSQSPLVMIHWREYGGYCTLPLHHLSTIETIYAPKLWRVLCSLVKGFVPEILGGIVPPCYLNLRPYAPYVLEALLPLHPGVLFRGFVAYFWNYCAPPPLSLL